MTQQSSASARQPNGSDAENRPTGPEYTGPGATTRRSQLVAGSMRRMLRPALDRMPAELSSLNRLRTLTSGAGRAAALETSGNWSSDGPVPGLWVGRRSYFASDKAIYMLHGGGFTFGSPWSHKSIVGRLVREAGAPAFVPDYRLAPEHVYPAAVEDAVAGWEWMVDHGYHPENMVVCGDSAGGNLALQLIAHLVENDLPLPRAAVLMSPWVDMDLADMTSRDTRQKDPFLALNLVEHSRDMYAPGMDPSDPRISPVNLTFSPDWPPILIQCGGAEIFAGGIEMMHERMVASGADAELQVWPDQFHVFQAFSVLVPEGNAAFRDIGRFLRAQLGPTG